MQLLPSLGTLLVLIPHALSYYAEENVISASTLSINSVPFSTRAHWMRRANIALDKWWADCDELHRAYLAPFSRASR